MRGISRDLISDRRSTGWTTAALVLVLTCSDAFCAGLEGQAVAGRPFGVGQVTFAFGEAAADVAVDQVAVTEADERILYPAVAAAPLRRAIRRLLESRAPRPVTIYFLFTGDQPLDVAISGLGDAPSVLPIVQDDRLHRRFLQRWWREYRNHARRVRDDGDYPSVAEDYLVEMLSRRLQLGLPPGQQRSIARSRFDEGS